MGNRLICLFLSALLVLFPVGAESALKSTYRGCMYTDNDIVSTTAYSVVLHAVYTTYDADYGPTATLSQVIFFSGKNGIVSLGLNTSGYPQMIFYRNSAWDDLTDDVAVSDNDTIYITGVWYRNNTSSLWVNGEQVATESSPNYDLTYYNFASMIGSYPASAGSNLCNTASHMNGIVHEVCAWSYESGEGTMADRDIENLHSGTYSCKNIDSAHRDFYLEFQGGFPVEGTSMDGVNISPDQGQSTWTGEINTSGNVTTIGEGFLTDF